MQQRILRCTGLLQLKHAIVIDHSDLWSRFDCDQPLIDRDYKILHLQDDMKLRYFYETDYQDKQDEKHVIVVSSSSFRIPYDISKAIPVIDLSYETLFPMFDAAALESMPELDFDHLSFVADKAAVVKRNKQETIDFCSVELRQPEWAVDYAEQLLQNASNLCQNAVSHREWMKIAKLYGKASMFQHSYVEMPDFAEKKNTIEKEFRNWISEKYAGLHGVSDLRRPVLLSKVNDFIRKGNNKIALLLMDGMSFENFYTIQRESLVSAFCYDVEASFSFFPTVTSVARQCVFSGKLPKELADPFSMGNEEKEWRQYWKSHGYKDQEIFFSTKENPDIPDKAKVVGIVIDICDKLMHDELQGLDGLLQGIENWMKAGTLISLVKTLQERGFAVFMTADHGNTATIAEGRFIKPGVLADPASRRAVVYQSFADPVELEKFTTMQYAGTYLPDGYTAYLFAEGACYGNPGQEYVTHGGMTIEEAVVPFVKIGEYHG